MKRLTQLWNEDYGVARSLEAESWFRRLVNTHVLSTLMNTFPNATTKLFSHSSGELARRIFVEREGGSYRVLHAMYEYESPHHHGDFLNRVVMQSPAIKAARNRRKIAQWMLGTCLKALPPGPPRLVMTIGGGDGLLEAEVISRIAEPNVYYFGVDMDAQAAKDNCEVLEKHGLGKRGFTFTGSVSQRSDVEAVIEQASQKFGVRFDGVSVTVCQGLIEYIDMQSLDNENLFKMLRGIRDCTREDGGLLISQTGFHDRVAYLEKGLQWYMRLRDSDEVARELEKAGWQISICEQEPMKQITMCLATKSGVQHWRIDSQSPLRQPHISRYVSPPSVRRRSRVH